MNVFAGIARRTLDPFWGVELTGWGYYLERTWLTVADSLNATAVVIDNGDTSIAIVSVDLMVIDDVFTHRVRTQVADATGIPTGHILVAATHTHNAPAAGGLLGVGEVDPVYEDWAARQTATTVIQAWHSRQPSSLYASESDVTGLTFNRTREDGPVDTRLTTLRIDDHDGRCRALLVNFQAHPTVATELQPRAVSRDIPGAVCDLVESRLPGCLCLYLQGACGDVNFLRSFATPESWKLPAEQIARAVISAQESAERLDGAGLNARQLTAELPTRRWTPDEIQQDRTESLNRLATQDVTDWKLTIGRVMTNRPDDMVLRHGGDEWKAVSAMCRFGVAWTDRMLVDVDSRPETIRTEVQALRIGPFGIVANSTEFFTTLALDVRARAAARPLMIVAYANGRIGYLPDAHDVERRTYAAYQSPKYCNQFPFTAESGPAMCASMLSALSLAGCGSVNASG